MFRRKTAENTRRLCTSKLPTALPNQQPQYISHQHYLLGIEQMDFFTYSVQNTKKCLIKYILLHLLFLSMVKIYFLYL